MKVQVKLIEDPQSLTCLALCFAQKPKTHFQVESMLSLKKNQSKMSEQGKKVAANDIRGAVSQKNEMAGVLLRLKKGTGDLS